MQTHKLAALLSTVAGFGLAANIHTIPTKPIADPQPGDPLQVTMGQHRPARVRVARGQATLIRLPEGQRVMNVYGADKGVTGVWAVDAGAVPTRFVGVKPKDKNLKTTLHVISNTGQEISLYLEEVTGVDATFDALVDASDENEGSKTFAAEVKWVPADEVSSCKKQTDTLSADLSKANLQMRDQLAQTAKAAEAQKAAALLDYQQKYPTRLHFSYQWDHAKAERMGLEAAWSDEKFTYFKGSRVLSLYEINEDGKPSLIQYSYKDGIYTVPKILYDGYFAIGTKKQNMLTFHRERGKG